MKRHLIASILVFTFLTLLISAQVSTPQPVRTSQSIMEGLAITKVAPVYPPLARQAKIQGSVVLKVQISKAGDVVNIQLVSGHPLLAPAAIDAVRQWKYKPYLLNGDPVEVETQVTVNFTLSGMPAPEGTVGSIPGGVPEGEQGGIASGNPSDQSPAAIPRPLLGAPRRVRISSGVAQGLVVTKVPPQYPQDAKDQRIQGVVVLKIIVDKEGNVENIQLVSGHPLLAPSAIEAVKQWKYKPYLLNGLPVEVETQVQVNFTLMS